MATWLRFSMARSGPLGLYGLARNLELGVDLEAVSRDIDVDGVGSRFLAPAERDMLSALRGDEQQRGFYRLWARTEAVLKAIGVGLHSSTAGLDVSGEVARFDPTIPGSAGAAQVWFVHDLHVAPGYAAALACEASLPGGVPELRDVAELFHQAWPDEGAPHP
jgi:4'-phosphopantetheinyl transferase